MKKILLIFLTLLLMTNKSPITKSEHPASVLAFNSSNIVNETQTFNNYLTGEANLLSPSPCAVLTASPVLGISIPSQITYDYNQPKPEGTTPPPTPGIDMSLPDTNADADESISIITLSFAGDCTIGSDESYKRNTFDEIYEKEGDPEYFFRGIKNIFEADDFTFVNLEGTFTTATKKAEKEYRFKGDPSYCEILTKGSVEGVTLANNHTLDYLEKGFEDTVNTLTQAKISYTYFDTYLIKEIKGLKIGFLGYKGWGHEKRANTLVTEQVKQMREQGVDFIIANYHWGDMRSYIPNSSQIRMAHFAIDEGVDLVIGHHPHVLQGMEIYKGKNIIYSLGNFCYGGSSNPSDKDTIIYQHIICVDDNHDKIIDCSYNIIPALISSVQNKNNYQPIIATGEEKDRIMEKFMELSEKLGK